MGDASIDAELDSVDELVLIELTEYDTLDVDVTVH